MRLILVPAILVFLTAAAGAASASPIRFHLRDGETLSQAREYFQDGFNRQPTIDDTHCRLTDGTASSGWLHVACAGRDAVGGGIHRFTAVYTPITCTSMRIRLSIATVIRVTRRIGWSSDSPVRCHAR